MLKPTKHIINNFCAFIFAAALLAMLAVNSTKWYTEGFTQIKDAIDERFAVIPDSEARIWLNTLFFQYLDMTNRTVANGVIILNDERLVIEKHTDMTIMFHLADEVISLSDYLNTKDTPFLFVRAPDAMQDYTQLPHRLNGIVTTLEDTQRFVTHLTGSGIEVLDLREEMTQDSIDFGAAYFHGDHHWNAYGSLYAYGKIGERLSNEYGYNLDNNTWDKNEYEAITYPKAFLGGLSSRLSDTKEDITALLPRFHTDIEVRSINPLNPAEHMGVLAAGSFTEVFVPKANESGITSFDYRNLNIFYDGFYRFTNRSANNDKKILFIADSFGIVPVTYLSTAFRHVDYLYLRNDDASVLLYPQLAKEEYDFVLFLLSEDVILSSGDDLDEDRIHLGNPAG